MPTTVIGNGPSRKGIDLASIPHWTIGCNALYRDFSPDLLIATDPAMIREILESGYEGQCLFKDHGYEYPYNVGTFPNHTKVKSSGLYGVKMALKEKDRVYCLGFDFDFGTNVYQGSENYGKRNGGAVREYPIYLEKLCRSGLVTWVSDYKCDTLEDYQISLDDYILLCARGGKTWKDLV